MEPSLTPAKRWDALEYEEFKQMTESPSFQILTKRIHAEYVRKDGDCLTADESLAIHRAQGACAALAMVLGLPERILAEMKPK